LEGALTCNLESGECCVMDKKTKVKFDITTHHSEGLLEFVHVDVWDPINVASFGDHRYFILFVDNLSKRCWVYPMK